MNDRYRAYLLSPEWRKVKHIKLQRAEKRCQRCGNFSRKLDVHHLTYLHIYHELDHLDDLKVSCPKCHTAEHSKPNKDGKVKKTVKTVRITKAIWKICRELNIQPGSRALLLPDPPDPETKRKAAHWIQYRPHRKRRPSLPEYTPE